MKARGLWCKMGCGLLALCRPPVGGRSPGSRSTAGCTQIRSNYQGPANAGKIIVSTGQMSYTPFAWSPEDLEFLATRKLSNEDAARIFDCPPTAVGIVDCSTYSNTEQEALALVRNCLAPLAARFELAFARCLLSDTGRRQFFLRHDFSELLRGDIKARFDAYRVGQEIGVYSANDIRRLKMKRRSRAARATPIPSRPIGRPSARRRRRRREGRAHDDGDAPQTRNPAASSSP